MSFVLKSLQVSAALVTISLLANCAGHHSSSAAPASNSTDGVSGLTLPKFQLKQVKNYGVNKNMLSVELDGLFAGSENGTADVVTASCKTNPNPALVIVSDSASAIQLTMGPIDDDCTFSVEGASNSTGAITLSSTAQSLPPFQIANLTHPEDVQHLGVEFTSSFPSYGPKDFLFYSCDGSAFQSVKPTAEGTMFMATAIAMIPAPQNALSCLFYLQRNGIDAMTVKAFSVASSSWTQSHGAAQSTIYLNGMFNAVNDIVHLDCKDQAEQTFSADQIYFHSSRTISVQLPIPTVSTTCQVYVSSDALQTKPVDVSYVNPFLDGPGFLILD